MLPALMYWHRAALRTDLKPLGVSFDDIMWDRISWNEAWDYISGLLRSPTSHLYSEMQGDKYFPAESERTAWDIAELNLNAKRTKGKSPIRLPRPWGGKPPTYLVESKPDAARDARRAKLAAMF